MNLGDKNHQAKDAPGTRRYHTCGSLDHDQLFADGFVMVEVKRGVLRAP